MDHNLVFYIHTDILAVENFSIERESLKKFFKEASAILEVGRHLKAEVYCSKRNTELLNQYFNECEEYFSPNIRDQLYELLKDFKESKDEIYLFDVVFSHENTQLFPSTLPMLDEPILGKKLIVFSLKLNQKKPLMFVKSESEFGKIDVNIFNNDIDIWEFIRRNIDKRDYHFNEKHGNIDKKANPPTREKVSQLLCNDNEAQELLNTAIFDLREKSRFHYNFDSVRGTYVVFPYEGKIPQNLFHAYHIQKDEWEKEIPSSIRAFFDKSSNR